MAVVRDLSRAQLAFQVAGGEVDQFLVVRFRGTEGLCQLYRFEIDLVCTEEEVAFDDIVGKAAVLSINTSKGQRYFHGVVSRFEMTGETEGQTYFRAELVPAVWLLTHRYDSRIFQNKSVPDIISEVLTQAGMASDRVDKSKLSGTHDPREYCVQYRETDYNFICRLMEEEGIWWCFKQTRDGHILFLADDPAAYQPIEGDDAKLAYRPPSGMNIETEHVFRFRLGQCVRPGAVALNDFNFTKPPLDLKAKADAGRDTGLEFSDYPGEYDSQAGGKNLAKLRIEEFESARVMGVGQSNSYRLSPGLTFELTEHPSTPANRKYLLTKVLHQGRESTTRTTGGPNGRAGFLDARVHQSLLAARQSSDTNVRELAEALLQIAARLKRGDLTAHRALTNWLYHAGQVSSDLAAVAQVLGSNALEAVSLPNLMDDIPESSAVDDDASVYECRFECIPEDVTYRPPRVTPWPVMRGTQTARVVGPSGEEIHTDEYGRVKVQFNWDRKGNEGGDPKLHGADSSCWIRVAQGMAGGAYGHLFLPRVGQEVVVDFLEGNPDQPIIVGRVYNADHMPAYKLPDEKTKSYIKTHSSKGGGGNHEIRFEDAKGKEQLLIQAQRRMDTRVKGGHFHTTGSYDLIVGGEKDGQLFGGYLQLVHKEKRTHVKDYREMWVEGNESYFVQGDQYVEVGGNQYRLVTGNTKLEAANRMVFVGAYGLYADTIRLSATQGIELACGGSSIVLTPGGIWINGTMVHINSGAGASQPDAPDVPQPTDTEAGPAAADSTKPGKDTRYDGGEQPPPGEMPEDLGGEDIQGEDFKKETYLEYQLLDAEEKPVANEDYRVELPDGTVKTGKTDGQGIARFEPVQDGGVGTIQFPNREDGEWVYLRTEYPGASTGGSGGGGGTGGTGGTGGMGT